MKNNYPETVHLFFTGRSIFSYFLRLNYYNFCPTLPKSIKPHFSRIALYPLKTDQNLHPYGNPVRNNGPLKILKNCLLWHCSFEKLKR